MCLLLFSVIFVFLQGDHLSGKPGNVRKFETCQGKNLVREKCPKNCSLLVEYLHSTPFFLLVLLADLYFHTFKFAVPVSRFCMPLLFKLH